MIKNYKIIIAYDGGRYNGWQKQGNTENTLQEKFETILSQLAGEDIEIFASGRTDAGTHATGQTANFHMEWAGEAESLMDEINERLPEDIAVREIFVAPTRFHSRLNAKWKRYTYTIWNSKKPPVFLRKYSFWCKTPLDREKMEAAAAYLTGEHDFKSFCANKRMKKTTVRSIYAIDFKYENEKITISFSGSGFLYQMIRIITGTLIEIGEGKREAAEMKDILQAKNREAAGFTAPSRGLALREVFYEGDED